MSKHIFIIDDDESILQALEYLLTQEGYSVTASDNGKDALNLLQNDSFLPDVLILDVLLPGLDGREIAKTLRRHERTKDLPIIMISANITFEKLSKECQVDKFIPKPFDITVLLDAIEKVN